MNENADSGQKMPFGGGTLLDLLDAHHGVVPVALVFNVIFEAFFISYGKTFNGGRLAGCLGNP